MRQYFLLFLLLFLLSACGSISLPYSLKHAKEEQLYRLLITTIDTIDHVEARKIAVQSISFSEKLARRYDVTTPPLVHNFLVNIGIKDRGLCYQWSDDLYLHLKKFGFKTIQIRPVGANIGSYWREHNALVILPLDGNMNNGILLDPWRGSGDLYFIDIKSDPDYKWKIRKDRIITPPTTMRYAKRPLL